MSEFTADGTDRTTTLRLSGLTCDHCVAHVTEELKALDGVEAVVAGRIDGLGQGGVVQDDVGDHGGHRLAALAQDDGDVLDAVKGLEFLGDVGDAVVAGQARELEGGGAVGAVGGELGHGCAPWVVRSGPHEAGDRVGGLADLGLALGVGRLGGVNDAVAHVVLEQAEADGLEGLGGRGDLGEDVDAVRVLLDHAGDAANLALNAAQPLEVVVLGACVAGHPRLTSSPASARYVEVLATIPPGGRGVNRVSWAASCVGSAAGRGPGGGAC